MSDKSLRSRTVKSVLEDSNSNMPPNSTTTSSATRPATRRRNPPHLPTATELLALGIYPVLLTFGTVFSVFNPDARGAPYDAYAQSHVPGTAPSYFARKDNLINVLFVKKGWAWFTVAFFTFLVTHPSFNAPTAASSSSSSSTASDAAVARKFKAILRYILVTTYWVFVTQWCFGPALIDRGFRYTGGKCEVAQQAVFEGDADKADALTAVACKASGGRWSGGHDISGHVFLLMLGSWMLVQEVGWVILRASAGSSSDSVASAATTTTTTSTTTLQAGNGLEERAVVMADGAVKGASVEAAAAIEKEGSQHHHAGHVGLGAGGKIAATVVALSYWMLLMTAIYFHTWFEKVSRRRHRESPTRARIK